MTVEYYIVEYDTQAGGSFTAGDATPVTWNAAADQAWIVKDIDEGTTGKLYIAWITGGSQPVASDTLTQGGVTANVTDDAILIDYPAYMQEDLQVASSGAITWTGPALSVTHSFFFDGQTGNVTAGDTLTFSPGGQTAEVITVVSDAGATGELDVRFISNIDEGYPDDGDTFSNGASGDGAIDGPIFERSYLPLALHRFLQDLNDNPTIYGNDDLSRVDPIASSKDTDQIINLLGTIAINDTVSQHLYGGSVSQASGDTLYSGLNVQVTSPNADTQPVLIKDDSIITDYWKNALNPDSIAGNIRILIKTREDGIDFDGKRIKGKLLEYGDSHFIGSTTLGLGTTALALFSSTDGNNDTAEGTVSGAPYNSIVITEGYQTEDYNNGNGAVPLALTIDFGSANSKQTYERARAVVPRPRVVEPIK